MSSFQFMNSHIDRIGGVLVKVTVITVVEAIPEPDTHPVPGYILPGGKIEE